MVCSFVCLDLPLKADADIQCSWGVVVVRTALTNGAAQGPPVGFSVIIGPDIPDMSATWLSVELFSVTEHDDDDDADEAELKESVAEREIDAVELTSRYLLRRL